MPFVIEYRVVQRNIDLNNNANNLYRNRSYKSYKIEVIANIELGFSELVDEVFEERNLGFETLTLADGFNHLSGARIGLHRIVGEFLPVIEDALREGTAGSGSAEGLGETERLSDGQVSLNVDERSSINRVFTNDNTTAGRQAVVDATDTVLRALDLDEENGLLELGCGNQHTSVEAATSSRDNLTTTSVDSVSMESNILNVNANTAHVLLGHDTFLGSPLESSLHGVLNFVQVLHGLGRINEQVGTGGFRTESPDLECIIGVPVEIVTEEGSACLRFLLGSDRFVFNSIGELISKRLSYSKDSVMLVGRLGQALHS
jgi:hypothetical protein